jgi:type I restriction enzyme R subunit
VPFEDKGGYFQGRYYQDIAVERVLAAIADGRERILLTLATGTGKTFIAFQIAWKLFHSPLEPERLDSNRASRRAGRASCSWPTATSSPIRPTTPFSAFPEDALVRIAPDDIRKKGKVPKNGSLFFTIFQTFMSGPPKDGHPSPYFGEYPPDFFDFIIIDECHRGGANDESNWRGILDYFAPAVQLGLTATPKRKDNVDTYAYFGEPVFIYSLKDGINDGFLTPFRVKQIATTLDEYIYTPDDKLVEGEIEAASALRGKGLQQDHRDQGAREEAGRDLHGADRPEREDAGVLRNQVHALVVRDLINQMKTSKRPQLLPARHGQ